MTSTKQELANAICSFLKDSISDNTISPENHEGMEVAIDCIKEAFALEDQKSDANLMQIFQVYTNTIKKQKEKAAPAVQPPRPSSEKDRIASEELKSQGNKLLSAKNFEEAIVKYTEAIDLYESAVYYSNRAAAYSQCGRHELAAADAKRALEVDPGFTKAFSRLGHAEFCLGNYEDAVKAYKNGLEKEPNNASLKQSLAAAEQKLNAMSVSTPAAKENSSAGGNPFASMMGGGAGGMPDFGAMMSDPSFMAIAQNMMSNPALAGMLNNPALRNMMGGAGGVPDMAAMMNNPEIAQMAKGLMSDPNAMSSLMNNPDLKKMAEKYAPK